jgi:hypothetical protein
MSTLESSVQFENIFYPYIFSEISEDVCRMEVTKLTEHLLYIVGETVLRIARFYAVFDETFIMSDYGV